MWQKALALAKIFKGETRKERAGSGVWPRVCLRTGTGVPSKRNALRCESGQRRKQLIISRRIRYIFAKILSTPYQPSRSGITCFWFTSSFSLATAFPTSANSLLGINRHIINDTFSPSVHPSGTLTRYPPNDLLTSYDQATLLLFTSISTSLSFSAIFQKKTVVLY